MISEQWIRASWMTQCQLPSWELRAQLQFQHKQTSGCFSLWLLPLFIKNHHECFHPIKSTRGIQTAFPKYPHIMRTSCTFEVQRSTCDKAAVSRASHSLIFLPSCVLLYSSTCVRKISWCYTHIHLCQTHVAVWQLLHVRGNPSHTGGVMCEWVPPSPWRPEWALNWNWQHFSENVAIQYICLADYFF